MFFCNNTTEKGACFLFVYFEKSLFYVPDFQFFLFFKKSKKTFHFYTLLRNQNIFYNQSKSLKIVQILKHKESCFKRSFICVTYEMPCYTTGNQILLFTLQHYLRDVMPRHWLPSDLPRVVQI